MERNHQDKKRIDAQHKHIPNVGKKMNSIVKREHTIKHLEIQDRIKAVHGHTNRGKYVEEKAGEKRSFDDI